MCLFWDNPFILSFLPGGKEVLSTPWDVQLEPCGKKGGISGKLVLVELLIYSSA